MDYVDNGIKITENEPLNKNSKLNFFHSYFLTIENYPHSLAQFIGSLYTCGGTSLYV